MKRYTLFLSLVLTVVYSHAQQNLPLTAAFPKLFSSTEQVETKFFPSDSVWVSRRTFLLKNLTGFKPETNLKYDRFGGELGADKHQKTGFFYTKKIDDRWWIIDPDGNKWYCKAMVALTPNGTPRGKQVLQDSFKTNLNWALKTADYMQTLGFNAAGAWSKIQDHLPKENQMVYSLVLDVMASFGKYKNVAYQGTGHMDYKSGIMPVFDPEFESFAIKHVAEKVSKVKNDPWLLGYYSDNELNFRTDAINRFLKLAEDDPNYKAVKAWALQNKVDIGKQITKESQLQFLAFYVEEYYRVVASAIKKADPNHLFLSSRLHGVDKNRKEVFKAAGKYSDIISYNYYKSWYPEDKVTKMWAAEADKPYMITEWYAKGMDSGMPNTSGWGWTVKTQEDRGKYYQNFALGLLADKNCVGWHWFKYMDNDPTGKADPSNIDSNKGIVTWDYKIYTPLTESMQVLNNQAYPLIRFFDQHIK